MKKDKKNSDQGNETPPSVSKKEFISRHIRHIYEGTVFENRIYDTFVNTLKMYIVATRKFLTDDCFTKASAIAYTAIISLIPALTVILTFYSIFSGAGNKKDELFRDISLFMIEHSIKINIDPVFDAISGLIDNAGKIGGIGAVIMLFSATATLRALEKSLNDIWKVKQGRSLFQKVIYYWAALTLGPVMLIAGTTVATKMSDVFSSAHYSSAHVTGDSLWIVGSKGTILSGPVNNPRLKFKNIEEAGIDYENQSIFSYKFTEKKFVENEFRLDHMGLRESEFRDVQFIGDQGWIVGSKGIILHTEDKAKNWRIYKAGNFTLNDIHMLDSTRGFIAADSGVILKTSDSGRNWEVIETGDTTSNFNSISFYGNSGIITGNRGAVLMTYDGGATWASRKISEAKRKKKLVDLNCTAFINSSDIWIAGNDGIILHSRNGGRSWTSKRFKEYNYYSSVFLNKNEGYLAGENGIVIHTKDGGESWKSDKLPAYKINSLFAADKKIWAIGNGGTIQTNDGKGWKGKSGKGFFAIVINFLAPFLFIWVLFLLAYTTIPNTKIPFRYSSAGAAFTGAIWVIFILLFIVYIKSFAKGTLAIYGALASIPIFLLMVYASSLIILYGAEVSYTMMHPETYRNLKHAFDDVKKVNIYFGFIILQHIYFKFEEGGGSSTFSEIIKKISYNSTDFDYFVKLFSDKDLILKDEEGNLMPATSSAHIKLIDIFDIISEAQYSIPSSAKRISGKGNIRDVFTKLKNEREKVLKDMTLKDLII